MMYSEFIERTTYGESYMTYSDYSEYIEPVYMACDCDKDTFCKAFKKAFFDHVHKPVEMLIRAKSIEEKADYICGDESIMNDVHAIEAALKEAFLKTCAKYIKIK